MLHGRCCVHNAEDFQPVNLCIAATALPCLQEVQSNHFDNFLSPELQKAGYTAIYKRKTTELYTGTSYAIDGCATFFKRDKFALVKKYEVWSDLHIARARLCNADTCNALQHGLLQGARLHMCAGPTLCCFMCRHFHVQPIVCCGTTWSQNCSVLALHCIAYLL